MVIDTLMSWADHTYSHCRGCEPVHIGCDNCYAQGYFRRSGIDVKEVRQRASDSYLKQPIKWNREAEEAGVRRRVFPSLCDPFEDWQGPIVDSKGRRLRYGGRNKYSPGYGGSLQPGWATMTDLRRDFFGMIDQTPYLDWLLLTKWPENIRRMWYKYGKHPLDCDNPSRSRTTNYGEPLCRENAHLLYSASDQETLEAGIGHLLACRDLSPVLGLSLEPLVGPVDLSPFLGGWRGSLDRVIAGGESGPNARPCQIEWIVDIAQQCKAAGVALFVKQDSGPKAGQQGRIPDDIWAIKEHPNPQEVKQ